MPVAKLGAEPFIDELNAGATPLGEPNPASKPGFMTVENPPGDLAFKDPAESPADEPAAGVDANPAGAPAAFRAARACASALPAPDVSNAGADGAETFVNPWPRAAGNPGVGAGPPIPPCCA